MSLLNENDMSILMNNDNDIFRMVVISSSKSTEIACYRIPAVMDFVECTCNVEN